MRRDIFARVGVISLVLSFGCAPSVASNIEDLNGDVGGSTVAGDGHGGADTDHGDSSGGAGDPANPGGDEAPSDECDTTAQCQAIWGSQADDCLNSQSSTSVCMCGPTACSELTGGDDDTAGGDFDGIVGSCEVFGTLEQWHRVEIRCEGVPGDEADAVTFTDRRFIVTFTNGSETVVVPGHFAADGVAADSGATTGSTWRAYFMPPSQGTWTYDVSFRHGADIAVAGAPTAGSAIPALDGLSDTFTISVSSAVRPDTRARGLLAHSGSERYLRFAGDAKVFVSGGMDSPENLFGYSDFDNTTKESNVASCKGILHDFAPHEADWQTGDPTWAGDQGKGLIGLVNYIASTGVNTIYLVIMSVDGDGCDGHPWSDYYGDRRAFDVSKLDQWERVFGHMTRKGLMIHIVTQETENDQLLNGGALGLERMLYYRELISRFGHHPALQWNLGEENTNTTAQQEAFSSFIDRLDPYGHPIVMHTFPGEHANYDALLGYDAFDGPTLQYGDIPADAAGGLYGETLQWIADSTAAGRTWVVTATEASGADAPTPNSAVTDTQRIYWMWANVMAGGGGIEWYLKNSGAGHAYDLAVEDLREFDAHWAQTGHLVRFFRDTVQGAGVDLTHLEPDNGATSSTSDWVLADPGHAYVIFLRDGGTTNLTLPDSSTYDVSWLNPRSGVFTSGGTLQGPGAQSLGAPPAETTSDWAVFVAGPPTPACDYEADGDVVVIEAEDLAWGSGWDVVTASDGNTGSGYATWTGGDAFNTPGNGATSVDIYVTTAGRYRFQWRNRVGAGADPTEHNDTWVRFGDADAFYGMKDVAGDESRRYPRPLCEDTVLMSSIASAPGIESAACPEGASSSGWLKVYSSGALNWAWSTFTNDNDGHGIYVELDNPGVYTLELSGRSDLHEIDRMVLHLESVSSSAARDLALTPTPCN